MSVRVEAINTAATRGREILNTVQGLLRELEAKDETKRLLAAGKIHEIEQVYAKARACYEAILAKTPKQHEARARLAIVLLKSGHRLRGLEIALNLTKEAADFRFSDITGRPRSAQAVLGDACRDNGDTGGAKKAYGRALELEPGDAHAAAQLTRILLSENAVESAADLAERHLHGQDLAAFRATKALLANDPLQLPALSGLVMDQSLSMADHI
jgi:tetratricopeptide (TPR) repeat protein